MIITPKTKVAQLLDSYPQLEEVLIRYVPQFEKLRNPALRRTIARITSLHQAAAIGKVNIEELIHLLREEVGQDLEKINSESNYTMNEPKWYRAEALSLSFDVREMLSRGEHPVNQVMADLQILEDGRMYELIAPFLPAPLIDKASSIGMSHYVKEESDGMFRVFFCRAQ
jgi:uncharacterized protein (DUF2249 family)